MQVLKQEYENIMEVMDTLLWRLGATNLTQGSGGVPAADVGLESGGGDAAATKMSFPTAPEPSTLNLEPSTLLLPIAEWMRKFLYLTSVFP